MIRIATIAITAAIVSVSFASIVSAQSAGTTAVVAEMTKDRAKMKDACSKGREGVTAYTMETIGALTKAGNTTISASVDGPAAGAEAGKRCPEFMR